jgi:pimeloyl-ACP methyl ester carboxylesterase
MDEKKKIVYTANIYTVNGIQLHVAEAGNAEAMVIIFLHGFPEFWYGWRNQINYFVEKGYRVVVPDQRGYNLSSKPPKIKDYRMELLTKDISGLVKAIGADKVFLVGHDWGGAVAWAFAQTYPQLLSKLIIINVPHPKVMLQTLKRSWKQKFKSMYIGFFQFPWLPEKLLHWKENKSLVDALVNTSLPGTFSEADVAKYKEAWQQSGSLRSMINWYRAVRYGNIARVSSQKIPTPTLIIWGENDQFLIEQMAHDSLQYCENGQLHIIKDATHWVHHEKSGEVNKLISEFIGH